MHTNPSLSAIMDAGIVPSDVPLLTQEFDPFEPAEEFIWNEFPHELEKTEEDYTYDDIFRE